MAILVSTANSAFSRYKRDISDVSTATFTDWCDYINKMTYRFLLGIDPARFITTQNYTITTYPSTQALPTDLLDMKRFGCGVFEVDDNGDDTTNQVPMTEIGSIVQGYYINGGNIVFTGITGTYQVRYVPDITTIDALTDYFTLDTSISGVEIIPSDYTDFLMKALDVMYDQWDEDVGMEGIADARFVRLLDEFARNINRSPAVYGLDDFSNSF